MAAVKVSDIRNAVRINLEDPLRWNEVVLGIGAQGQPNQRVYQLPTFPVAALSEVLTINNVPQVRGADYTITNDTGQIFYANPPTSGAIAAYWQWGRWSDTQLNQWITEAVRMLSLYVPKLAKITHKATATDVLNQGWYTDPNTLRVYKVRSFDPSQPLGSDLLWQEIPYWSWDDPDHFLRLDGEFLVGDQFQHLERQRWSDPDIVNDIMDPGGNQAIALLRDTFQGFQLAGDAANWTTVTDSANTGIFTATSNLVSTSLATLTAAKVKGGKSTWTDVALTIRFAAKTGCTSYFGVRHVDINNEVFGTATIGSVGIIKAVNGVQTGLVNNESAPVSIVDATWYWARISIVGSLVSFQVFADGAGVPGAAVSPLISANAPDIPTSGFVFFRGYNGTGGAATMQFGGNLSQGPFPTALVDQIVGTGEAWPVDFNDPVSWLVASLALEKEESPRDMAGLEGNVLDAQVTPMGGFVKDAATWRKKFADWLSFYRGAKYTQRPRREPYIV